MGKALRISIYKILVLFLALSSTHTFQSYSQVPLVDLRSFEISFTAGESNRERNGVHLSMQEAKRMSGLEIDEGQPFKFTSNPENQEGFFYVDSPGGTSLGRYYHSSETNVLSQLPIRNGTPNNISGISIAFDFVYKPEQTRSQISYRLSYKVNDGRWILPPGGFFTSDLLQAENEKWSSFSMQIMIDQLYLLPNDQLDIRWTATGADRESGFIPVALQKIELFANKAEPKEIHPGSLIISEVMPAFETESGRLEYVELYNSTEDPINLKGLILKSGKNRIVVQNDVVAEPYKPVVLTGHDGSDGSFKSFTDYHFTERLLEENSGSLSLSFDGKDVARALFETSKPGTAVQMNSLEKAFDGYSSLSHFEQVAEQWAPEISGNPGRIKPESRLYSKEIQNGGWYLLEPPGQLSEALNRDLSSELIPIQHETDVPEHSNSKPPYIYYHPPEAEPSRIYSSGRSSIDQSNQRIKERTPIFKDAQLFSINVTQQSSINDLINPAGDQAFPALLTWNESSQKFDLVWREDDTLSPWNSYMVSGQTDVSEAETNNEEAWTGITRSIGLSLVSESGQDSDVFEYDRSLVGFWNPKSRGRSMDFSLPKLWTPLSESSREARDPMLYLKSSDAVHVANSYLNFPFTPDELLQISVGLKLPANINRARFVWDSIDTLPEKWDIEFVDSELGESVKMREENSYSFSERFDVVRDGMDDPNLSFQPVEPDDYSRFYIRISSTGSLGVFEPESETPESVELKQNYPNPFNPTTTIGFYVPKTTDVRIGVFNVVGQQVGLLIDERLSPGDHTVSWNAMDMPSGVYIVQLEAMNTVQTRKITLIK